MLLYVIDVNGPSRPDLGERATPPGTYDYYVRLAGVIGSAVARGHEVQYQPNWYHVPADCFGDDATIERAWGTDPLLARLDVAKDDITLLPAGQHREITRYAEQLRQQDAAAKRQDKVVVCGAFLGECVGARADLFRHRNPGVPVAVDPHLSLSRGRERPPQIAPIPITSVESELLGADPLYWLLRGKGSTKQR